MSQISNNTLEIFGSIPFVKHNLNQKISTINLKDSTYMWMWGWNGSTSTKDWNLTTRTIYSYNANNKENGSVTCRLLASNWVNDTRKINYVFDSINNLLSQSEQCWDNINLTWINQKKTINTFDTINNLLSSLQQNWISNGLMWRNNYLYNHVYDTANNLIETYISKWDTILSNWGNIVKYTATYNSSHEYTSYVIQPWYAGSWVNGSRYVNLVYLNGDFLSYEWQTFNSLSNIYSPYMKNIFNYNTIHQVLNHTILFWDNLAQNWDKYDNHIYMYDSNGNQISLINQIGNLPPTSGLPSIWENSSKQTDYYSILAGLKELYAKNESVFIYPNPTNSFITISGSNVLNSDFSILDISGKVLFTGKNTQSYEFKINLSQFPSGIYFILFKNENSTVYRKLIKVN